MDYLLQRSKRKTLSLQVNQEGQVIVKAPLFTGKGKIDAFVKEHESWITKQLEKTKALQTIVPYTEKEIKDLTKQAKILLKERLDHYSKKMNISYEGLTIRHQKTRYGSCSSKGSINLNCILITMPDLVRDAIVVHELAHRKQMNHSKAFYEIVYAAYPEYDKAMKWLKLHGSEYLRKLG